MLPDTGFAPDGFASASGGHRAHGGRPQAARLYGRFAAFVRDGKWKLVAKGPTAIWELYDMEADRSEMIDMSGVFPVIADKMAGQWETWANDANVFPWPWEPYQRKFRSQK